jgi:hypothetical protein
MRPAALVDGSDANLDVVSSGARRDGHVPLGSQPFNGGVKALHGRRQHVVGAFLDGTVHALQQPPPKLCRIGDALALELGEALPARLLLSRVRVRELGESDSHPHGLAPRQKDGTLAVEAARERANRRVEVIGEGRGSRWRLQRGFGRDGDARRVLGTWAQGGGDATEGIAAQRTVRLHEHHERQGDIPQLAD